jgi:A/G-specific adenine glycosylase
MAKFPSTKAPPAVPAAPRKQPAPVIAAASDEPFPPVEFRKQLHRWYRLHARRLPWRGVDDPYATWLSEIMLQQTRVATVIDRYREFLTRFPTIKALAEADEADVLALWSGLGYYRRARMLHRGAQFVQSELGGKLPGTSAELRTLPGVGEYTAAAIASQSFGESIAVVDGNVERVLLRILGRPEDKTSKGRGELSRVAQSLVPRAVRSGSSNPPGDHNQAMMELGATICLPRGPLCLQCPVVEFCKTRGEHKKDVREKQRSRIVAHLLALRKRGTVTEVLLERRASDASLMPNMLELPPLPLEAVVGREPVLRVRHAITNTNYYVQVFAEGAPGVELVSASDDEELFVGSTDRASAADSLLHEIPAAKDDVEWAATSRLNQLPLTGLTRKVLQRLHVMAMPSMRLE